LRNTALDDSQTSQKTWIFKDRIVYI
jgi:hypothetical protein